MEELINEFKSRLSTCESELKADYLTPNLESFIKGKIEAYKLIIQKLEQWK